MTNDQMECIWCDRVCRGPEDLALHEENCISAPKHKEDIMTLVAKRSIKWIADAANRSQSKGSGK